MGFRNLFQSIFTKDKSARVFDGYIDSHSHLLPGVDDGVRSIEESLAILEIYENLGFRKIWLTPHIMEDYPNTTESLKESFSNLCQEYKGKIELALASENMIDELFVERLNNRDILPIGDERKSLLVETSYYAKPNGFIRIIEDIMSNGLSPVLAHPERYNYMDENDYTELKKMGVKFQLNLMSMTRYYGKAIYEKAMWIQSHGYYDFTGTDTHRRDHADILCSHKYDRELISTIIVNQSAT